MFKFVNNYIYVRRLIFKLLGEISASHGGKYVFCVIVVLMMEAVITSETSVNFYQTVIFQPTVSFIFRI
jgi:hypothetical protein